MTWGRRTRRGIWTAPPEVAERSEEDEQGARGRGATTPTQGPEGRGTPGRDGLEALESDAMPGQEPAPHADINGREAFEGEAVALIAKGKHSGGSRSRRYRGRHLGRVRRVLLPGPRRPGRHSATGQPSASETPTSFAPQEVDPADTAGETDAPDLRREEAERELEALLTPDSQEEVEVIAVETGLNAAQDADAAEPVGAAEPEPQLPIAPEYFFEDAPEPESQDSEHVSEADPDSDPEPQHMFWIGSAAEVEPGHAPADAYEPQPELGRTGDEEPEREHVYELAPEPKQVYDTELEAQPEPEPEPEQVYEHIYEVGPEPGHVHEPKLEVHPEAEDMRAPGGEDAGAAEPRVAWDPDREGLDDTPLVATSTAPETATEIEPEVSEPEASPGEPGRDEVPLQTLVVERGSRASRRAAIEQGRSERRRKRSVSGAVTVALIAVIALAGWLLSSGKEGDETQSGAATGDSVAAPGPGPASTLLFGTQRGDSGASEAVWLTLLTADPGEKRGSVVYIPAHTAVDVPGRGLQGVGDSYRSGGISLLLLSVENLLGIDIDRHAELAYDDARALFGATGALTVDVPGEVRVAAGSDQTRLVFVEGPQDLNAEMQAQLLYTAGLGGDDIDVGGRHLAFWDALLDRFESDPASLGDAVAKSGTAFSESDAGAEEHAALLEALAGFGSEDLTLAQLPVRPISAGDSELYSADEEELAGFIQDTVGIRPTTDGEARVQILNGNGVPGIGQQVARELVGHGFRVLLTGNARELTHRKTLIVTYDRTAVGRDLAQRARDLLGVGQVQVSAQQQGIVDLTIVVGKDFLRT
jgi:anionic cell wall polymer biosynthesis LytR-Cps2A-Psr (LCP) family protein